MEPKFGTSFIPKSTLVPSTRKKTGGTVGIFVLITLVIFLSTTVLALGVFLYKQFLKTSIERKNESLQRARAAFEPAVIAELQRIDVRLKSSEEILEGHVALSAFFDLLEELTLQSVRFSEFKFSGGGGRLSINMRGEARDFSSVALQSDIFGTELSVQEPIFGDLNLDQKGNVVFTFRAFLDPNLVRFRNLTADTSSSFQNESEQSSPEESEL